MLIHVVLAIALAPPTLKRSSAVGFSSRAAAPCLLLDEDRPKNVADFASFFKERYADLHEHRVAAPTLPPPPAPPPPPILPPTAPSPPLLLQAVEEAPLAVPHAPLPAAALPLPRTIPARRRAARILATTACVVLATAYTPPAALPLGLQRLRSAVLLPFAFAQLLLAKAAVTVTGRLVLPSVVLHGACA